MSIKRLMEEASFLLKAAGVGVARFELPRAEAFGELSCLSAFELARSLRRNPLEIASETASRINDELRGRPDSLFTHVEARNPGFLNFYVEWRRYASIIIDEVLSANSSYGFPNLGDGKTVLIEHTSVNPNKPLHLGHGRNVVLGDSLARLFSKLGYRVVVANYIDDSGNQMADLHIAFRNLGYPLTPPSGQRFDEYCGRVYAEVNRRIEEDPELSSRKRAIIAELEDASSETYRFNRELVDSVLRDQLNTCWRLGARYDILNRESDIITLNLWREVFERLKASGRVYLASEGAKKGCWLIDLSNHPILSKEGDEVLVKSDGTTTYVARDIAYAAWKLGAIHMDFRYSVWGENPDGSAIYITEASGDEKFNLECVERAINVIDVRQRRPQEVVRHSLELLGVAADRYIHLAYEVVALSRRDAERLGVEVGGEKFVHMSGRQGLYLTIDSVLDLLKERAVEEAAKRHPDWQDSELSNVGEKIAVAALRYGLVKQDLDKMIIFDTEEASSLEGDTGPYIQYSYARACRVIEKSGLEGRLNFETPSCMHEAEISLLRKISYMPLVVEEAARLLLLKKIAVYAHELSAVFNDFYEQCPILSADSEVMKFRLSLVECFRVALRNACWVLGIPLLDAM